MKSNNMTIILCLIHILLLFVGSIHAMGNSSNYDQELTKKLSERRIGHAALADNYGAYWPEIKRLVELGADPNVIIRFGNSSYHSLLQFIINYGSSEDVRYLLRHGARLDNSRSSEGLTPLGWAVFYGKIHMVRFFIQQGVDINQIVDANSKQSAIMKAVKSFNFTSDKIIIQELVTHGADLGVKDKEGKLVLDIAKEWGRDNIVMLLQTQKIP